MPLVRDVMTRRPVSVSPGDTVRTAMELLRSEQLDVLPVLEDGAIVASVTTLGLFRFYGEMPVSEALGEPLPEIEPDAAVGLAATRMAEHHARAIAVVQKGELVGLLTERDLAASWGSMPDPLTGLPWQDQMRRWASAHLGQGREIAILFLDLNGFGSLNKEHGHVLGDRALQTVANAIRATVDTEQDCLCRYGGDEFVIATTRALLGARSLAQAIRSAVAGARIPGEELSCSLAIGISGGQRSSQRPGSHAPATLDDLINLASRASTHAKGLPEQCFAVQSGGDPNRASGEPLDFPGSGGAGRTRVEGYQVQQKGQEVSVGVTLRRGSQTRDGSAVRAADDLRLATAEAAAAALTGFLPAGFHLEINQIYPCAAEGQGEVIGAAVTLTASSGTEERLFGAAPALPDPSRSVINAVLDATNRRLGRYLSGSEILAAAQIREA